MCQLELLSRMNHLFKKVVKMQSPRVQCCMCAVSVMSALLGMFMLSAGVCLVLNYNFLEVDTSGLPPNLHNEEGKKVVGIILICVGIVSLGVSMLVSILFYAACARTTPTTATPASNAAPSRDGQGRTQGGHDRSHHGTGANQARRSNGAAASAAMPNGRRANDSRIRVTGASALTPGAAKDAGYARNGKGSRSSSTPPGSSRPYRAGKKNHRHAQGRFRNSLPSHPEEAGGEGVGEAGRSSSRRLAFSERSGHVNKAAQLEDETATSSRGKAASSETPVTPAVVITVDSSHLTDDASTPLPPPQAHASDLELGAHSNACVVTGEEATVIVASEVDAPQSRDGGDDGGVKVEKEEEEESGRVSQSTVHSSDLPEEESVEEARKRLDQQMNIVISERL